MIQLLSSCLILIGSIFIFIASLGMIRLPDLFTKMHAATKVGTLGCGSILLGAGIAIKSIHGLTNVILLIFFIALTNPISAHLVAKIAYRHRQANNGD